MRIWFFFVLLFLFVPNAWAQNVELSVPCAKEDDGTVAPADYVPGVDVYGNDVVSADVDGVDSLVPVQYPLQIPVELDLLRFLDLELPEAAKDALNIDEVGLVMLTLHEDGRVEYNGQDISSHVETVCGGTYIPTEQAPPPKPEQPTVSKATTSTIKTRIVTQVPPSSTAVLQPEALTPEPTAEASAEVVAPNVQESTGQEAPDSVASDAGSGGQEINGQYP